MEVDVDAVPPVGNVVAVGALDVGGVDRNVEDVDRDEVVGFVEVVGIDVAATVDDVARGAVVEGEAGSVVDVVRAIVVPGVTLTVPDCATDSGRTSRNNASVTTKIALKITVDFRARPIISGRPEARCSSRRRAPG
ncbi:MAG: hypothetical protein JWM72_3449 [Actinomycetia bacterium]|nr:hypothetical protein [Actinomycetes bacterium]MDQ1458878.1 hypothetical protein [Actinomycetota bacterium]